jgi:hypothetical protein
MYSARAQGLNADNPTEFDSAHTGCNREVVAHMGFRKVMMPASREGDPFKSGQYCVFQRICGAGANLVRRFLYQHRYESEM